MPLELGGSGGKALIGCYVRTEYLRAVRIELSGGTHLPAESHAGDELVYVDQGSLFVFIPEGSGQRWFEIGPRDGMFMPAGVWHEYRSFSSERVIALIGEASTR
jgi:quercetin dioxygenase-like cupin family protein